MGNAEGGAMNNYKLPTDIESRFDSELGVVYEDCDNPSYGQEQSFDLLELTPDQVKKHFATEQVTLLESMVSEIEKMPNPYVDEYDEVRKISYGRHAAFEESREAAIAKVQAKLQEYKV